MAAPLKNPPASAADTEIRVQSPGQKDALEWEMATHSSILALENSMDREALWTIVHGAEKVGHG